MIIKNYFNTFGERINNDPKNPMVNRYSDCFFICIILIFSVMLFSCTKSKKKSKNILFEKIPSSSSNVIFSNDLVPSNSFNILNYINFYSGGGVALGDINNDGLLDIYLTANQKRNKLYLNMGNFKFKDITKKAGVGGKKQWTTGVSMADVNGDGLLDIYVCNAGIGNLDRKNELFINNGNQTFTDRAAVYGLDDRGNSIHATFFDYDKDGDLDMYLLNNYNSKPIFKYNLKENLRNNRDFLGGDRFYRNEMISNSSTDSVPSSRLPKFTDITDQTGIFSSEIGFGLGISVADINKDGWMDMYISNDFFERDYLYINNKDGTFKEALEEKLRSTSTTSMGGDIADLNNDGYPEIFVADMLPNKEERLKTNTDFIGWNRYRLEVKMGYHRKFTRNTLHYNNTDGTFSEIGRYAGVEATDWSWGGLMADFNLDGRRDIFVANGIYKDQTNKDYLIATTKMKMMQRNLEKNEITYKKLLEMMPTVPLSNYIFENQGELRFANRATEWGLDEPSFSNGSAYGDLDGDGDMDLVINNINMKSSVYRNLTTDLHPDRNWIQITLKGKPPNTYGVGSQVKLVAGDNQWYAEQMPQRGFQSSVDPTLNIGLGLKDSLIDTLKVHWPDDKVSLKTNLKTRQRFVIKQSDAENEIESQNNNFAKNNMFTNQLMKNVTDEIGINWKHEESYYNDFDQSPLLLHMRSTEGPPICTGDVNGDGRHDFYIGGAKNQPGALFIQHANNFEQIVQPALQKDRISEDTDCMIFDTDGDEISELYVASGSSEFAVGDEALADRLYKINEKNKLVRLDVFSSSIYKPTGVVRTADLDGDRDLDIFLGVRMDLSVYGNPVGGYLLQNDGNGNFEDVTDQLAPGLRSEKLRSVGITDAVWKNLYGDKAPDLLIAGEWMPLTIFHNKNGQMEKINPKAIGLNNTKGWWQSLEVTDLNGDGKLDFVGGNHGLNSRFQATPSHPVRLWIGDFDKNGTMEHIFATYHNDKGPYPVALLHNLIQRLPSLRSSYPSYAKYANQTVYDIFNKEKLKEEAIQYQAENLASIIGWNQDNTSFRIDSLPFKAQLSPIYDIFSIDLNNMKSLLIGGNLYNAKPQAGPYDASYGTILQVSPNSLRTLSSHKSGFFSSGEIRDIKSLKFNGQTLILVALNNNYMQIFQTENN